jgi:hypothetical protein
MTDNPKWKSPSAKDGKRNSRYPFGATDYFFKVPLRLIDDGWALRMHGSTFKRYISLLRLANYNYGNPEIKLSLRELARVDGVSTRTAWLQIRKLQEWGLIRITRTKPLTLTLISPSDWRESIGKRPVLGREAGRITVQAKG